MARRKYLKPNTSKTWNRDVARMVTALYKSDEPTVNTLKRFKKYSHGTKAAVVANFTRGNYDD